MLRLYPLLVSICNNGALCLAHGIEPWITFIPIRRCLTRQHEQRVTVPPDLYDAFLYLARFVFTPLTPPPAGRLGPS